MKGWTFSLSVFWMFFTTLYKTKSSQSRVTIRRGWLLRLIEWSLKKQKSIAVMLSRCKSAIKEVKFNYFFRLGESLNDSAITPKKYWWILHSFLHKQKIPNIPPICHNNMFVFNWYLGKSEYLQLFFAKQCSSIETDTELLADYPLTHNPLESVNLDPVKFLSIICAFNVSKVHG